MFYMEHNKGSKEQEIEFIGDMHGLANVFCSVLIP